MILCAQIARARGPGHTVTWHPPSLSTLGSRSPPHPHMTLYNVILIWYKTNIRVSMHTNMHMHTHTRVPLAHCEYLGHLLVTVHHNDVGFAVAGHKVAALHSVREVEANGDSPSVKVRRLWKFN